MKFYKMRIAYDIRVAIDKNFDDEELDILTELISMGITEYGNEFAQDTWHSSEILEKPCPMTAEEIADCFEQVDDDELIAEELQTQEVANGS